MVDADGTVVANYRYDPYGNILAATGDLAELNPLRYRGYYYDSDSHIYYLNSRYYDPAIGRFINADIYTSTGQGLIGNNMFAYCNNNPVIYKDAYGTMYERAAGGGGGGGVAWAGGSGNNGNSSVSPADVILAAFIIEELSVGVLRNEMFSIRRRSGAGDVYDYSAASKISPAITKSNTPHVHHIVPVGNFSNRCIETQQNIADMHEVLSNAGINRFWDPMNLLLVSASTHSSLHTDAYISHVHSYIMATDGSRQGIYTALFYLRLEIAAWDAYAMGY